MSQDRERLEEQQKSIEEIRRALAQRAQDRVRIEGLLKDYTERLFKGFQEAVRIAQEAGIESLGTPRVIQHPSGDWRRVMQLFVEDWSIMVVPLVGTAWPNIRDEAMIPGSFFKELCGRVAFFLSKSDKPNPEGYAFYDIIILLNSAWFAWGYGWPKQQDSLERTDFTSLSLDLLASFAKDIHTTWAIRDETRLALAMDPNNRAYEFGLPGDE